MQFSEFTSVDNAHSKLAAITYGVPQGSVLGPLHFLIYVNHIAHAVLGHNVKLFADDTNLFMSGRNILIF
jgi:ribonucleases P/MRP protein subunit RPP40